MNSDIQKLLGKNRKWISETVAQEPEYFKKYSGPQKPAYLWIGCSDSRVPAEKIVDANPGELFIHRNIANMVHQADLNILSVLQYSVEVLQVKNIIICGHYACGGVKASLETVDHGLIDNWIRSIKQIYEEHRDEFDGLADDEKADLLSKFNVRRQVYNTARSSILQKAWARGQSIAVHGLMYNFHNGQLEDLSCSIASPGEVPDIYRLH